MIMFGNRTPEQVEHALARAQLARKERASMIAKVRSGELKLCDVLESDDQVAKMLPVRTLLKALPGVGPQTAEAACISVGVPAGRRVRGLGERQRTELMDRLAR